MDRVEIRSGETGPEGPQDENIVNEIITDDEQGAAEERPDWLPEKFNSPEEMANAYAEAERKISQGNIEEEYEQEDGVDVVEEEGEEDSDQGEYFADMSDEALAPYSQEFSETGSISDESYEEISSKFGVPRDIAEAYVEGQKAIQQQMISDVMGTVGGPENYSEMIQWGQNNFSEEEQQTFDSTIAEGDIDKIKLAVSGVWARMQQARGSRGRLIQGSTPSNTNNSFQSIAEITAAMKDPRYKKDPAYRADVQRRLDSSNVI